MEVIFKIIRVIKVQAPVYKLNYSADVTSSQQNC